MEVLLTGNTMFLTKEWIEEAFPDDHVLTTHRKDDMLSDTRIKSVILDSGSCWIGFTLPTILTGSSTFQNICCLTTTRKASWIGFAAFCRSSGRRKWN